MGAIEWFLRQKPITDETADDRAQRAARALAQSKAEMLDYLAERHEGTMKRFEIELRVSKQTCRNALNELTADQLIESWKKTGNGAWFYRLKRRTEASQGPF